jgi:hypothetical protein
MRCQYRATKRISRSACAVAVCVAPAIGVAAAGAAGHAAQTPRLVLASRDPVRIIGSHFNPRERVRVTVIARMTRTHTLTASARGAFTTTFAAVVIDRCSAWSVTGVQRGHAPVVIRGAKPQCPPA